MYRIRHSRKVGGKVEYLDVKQVASIKGCSERYVRMLVKQGKIKAILNENPSNNKKEYLIAVEHLPTDLQDKYYNSINKEKQVFKESVDTSVDAVEKGKSKTTVDESAKKSKYGRDNDSQKKKYSDFSLEERKQIDEWIEIIKYWQEHRVIYENKAVADRDILGAINMKLKQSGKDMTVNITTLYRKLYYYENNDLEGLLDRRGGYNKGLSSIPDVVWSGFLNFYLDDRKMPFSEVYRNTVFWTEEFYPELSGNIPSEMSFRRRYKNEMIYAVEVYKRNGLKALMDRCIPYVDRLYDDLKANDVWIVDNHTLDIQTKSDSTDTIHRLSITAFMDAKSGIITGFNVTDNPSMNSTIFALRCGILKFGKPKAILADNGSEFLTYDFAGRRIRKQKAENVIEEYKTILGRLKIDFYTAKVKNAKAKNIERFFLDFKNHISKSFSTYTGGNITERPESLKMQLKKGNIPTDSRIRSVIGDMIMLENMNSYGGKDKAKYKGLSKIDVYNMSIKETMQTLISESDLDLYLMRAKKLQKVGRNGVYIKIADEKLWYNSDEYWKYIGKQVMVRYDPTNLATVRIYDEDDRYIDTWEIERQLYLSFIESDKDKISDANEKIARTTKAIKEYSKNMLNISAEAKIDILDLKIRRARIQSEGYVIDKSNIVHMQRIEENSVNSAKTGTEDAVIIDIDINRMNRNIEKRSK
jgi:transposase-like Mu (fragment)|nr:MAG TPA: transposase [Caudoviricetes sp.]